MQVFTTRKFGKMGDDLKTMVRTRRELRGDHLSLNGRI